MVQYIPELRWRTVGYTLERLMADIDRENCFLIEYKADNPVGYQWELRIARRGVAERGRLLHSHTTRQEAQAAARTHVGGD